MNLKKEFKKIIHRKNTLSKSIGLMFRKNVNNEANIFYYKKESKISIHMFFVFTKLDIITLNQKNQIIQKTTLKPWQTHTFEKKAQKFIELPKGTIKKYDLKEGKKIII